MNTYIYGYYLNGAFYRKKVEAADLDAALETFKLTTDYDDIVSVWEVYLDCAP